VSRDDVNRTTAADVGPDRTAALIARLAARGTTVAVAESLTGGLLSAELIRPAGASAVVLGGVTAYATGLKASVVGVDRALLDRTGPVDPEVARQLADRVRTALAVDGRPADVGLATTGVAGPDPDRATGQPPGTVWIGVAVGDRVDAIRLDLAHLAGDRGAVRAATVDAAIAALDVRTRGDGARE